MSPWRGIIVLLAATRIAQPAQQDDVVIRTTTNLVEVRVVAVDSHAKAIADLQKSEFEILDNGQPQTIRLFSAYRGYAASPHATVDGARDSSPTPAGYALILLDWMNCGYAGRLGVQEAVLKLLKSYQPKQRLAIYVLSRNNSRLLYDFTYDRDLLALLVERLSLDPEDMAGPVRDGGRAGRGTLAALAHENMIFRATNQLIDTTATFEKIADHFLHVPGRKALLWVSSGVPMSIDGAYYASRVERALNKLNSSDSAVYAIDASGFNPNPSASLTEFASRTGGVAFYLNNDLQEGIRQALEDMSVSYVLGFHMPEGLKPGPHAIRVTVNRPHIKLRYRESYDPTVAVH